MYAEKAMIEPKADNVTPLKNPLYPYDLHVYLPLY